jgi:hypothetical protein
VQKISTRTQWQEDDDPPTKHHFAQFPQLFVSNPVFPVFDFYRNLLNSCNMDDRNELNSQSNTYFLNNFYDTDVQNAEIGFRRIYQFFVLRTITLDSNSMWSHLMSFRPHLSDQSSNQSFFVFTFGDYDEITKHHQVQIIPFHSGHPRIVFSNSNTFDRLETSSKALSAIACWKGSEIRMPMWNSLCNLFQQQMITLHSLDWLNQFDNTHKFRCLIGQTSRFM